MNTHRVRERGTRTVARTGGVRGTGRAHSKAILLGEHSVVHGTPAIAFPVPALSVSAVAQRGRPVPVSYTGNSAAGLRFTAGNTLISGTEMSGPHVAVDEALRRWGLAEEIVEVVLDCGDIPPARGLGSSAACAGAAIRAVADLYGRSIDADVLYELVQCGEQVAHGRASGVDARAVLASGPIWFHQGAARRMNIGLDAALVLADTGMPGATQHAVAAVRRTLERNPHAAGRILDRAGELVGSAADDLAAGSVQSLGTTLLEFQGLLIELGVSTPEIDTLVSAALGAGAYGAKLTGAGLGGCVLALTEMGSPAADVSAALRRAGAVQTWIVPINAGQTPFSSHTRPESGTRQ
ncbi:MAG: mevalonate kinase [Nocardia sp.]|uniref:mevalonate kinase n=1 Tax=Nocardia sp. TaxID=1821 RepID=UPI002605CA83|nr:mevalonate kinase [Nocardia sp.]MCU1641483.1 mevalonate kinase [Nocardia sp.]